MLEGQTLDFAHLKRYSMFGGVTPEAFETIRPLIHIKKYAEIYFLTKVPVPATLAPATVIVPVIVS